MPIEFIEHDGGKSVEIVATGQLQKSDYDIFVPRFEKLIEKFGEINVLFVMRDFDGFDMWALWEDVKLEYTHYSDIDRLGMVGETTSQEWMANFCRPFSKAAVKVYSSDELDEARSWVIGS